jgi:hypothetical protein
MKRTYRKDYQEHHDIDWFAIYEGIPIHVASNGGEIPSAIKSVDNRAIQKYLAKLNPLSINNEIEINEEWIDVLKNEFEEFNSEAYLRTFVEFAKLGFVSIDNAIIGEEYQYKIVAFQKNREKLFSLNHVELCIPEVVKEEMRELKISLW